MKFIREFNEVSEREDFTTSFIDFIDNDWECKPLLVGNDSY
jgi:hypothetical protein